MFPSACLILMSLIDFFFPNELSKNALDRHRGGHHVQKEAITPKNKDITPLKLSCIILSTISKNTQVFTIIHQCYWQSYCYSYLWSWLLPFSSEGNRKHDDCILLVQLDDIPFFAIFLEDFLLLQTYSITIMVSIGGDCWSQFLYAHLFNIRIVNMKHREAFELGDEKKLHSRNSN